MAVSSRARQLILPKHQHQHQLQRLPFCSDLSSSLALIFQLQRLLRGGTRFQQWRGVKREEHDLFGSDPSIFEPIAFNRQAIHFQPSGSLDMRLLAKCHRNKCKTSRSFAHVTHHLSYFLRILLGVWIYPFFWWPSSCWLLTITISFRVYFLQKKKSFGVFGLYCWMMKRKSRRRCLRHRWELSLFLWQNETR